MSARIKEKRYLILNQGILSFGVSLLIAWSNFFGDLNVSLLWGIRIGLMVFVIIIPISFKTQLASKKQLFRFSLVSYMCYALVAILQWYLYFIPFGLVAYNYLIIILTTVLLYPIFYFGMRAEFYTERTFYRLCSINFSLFNLIACLFIGTLPGIDIFYQITFALFILFILVFPSMVLLKKAELISESKYQKIIEINEHILVGSAALLLAGIPIVLSNNWILAIGIFFTVFSLFSSLIHLYFKKYLMFMI